MVNALVTQLNEGLQKHQALALNTLSQGSNVEAEKQVINWMVQWISQGPVDQRQEAASEYLKNTFNAQQEIQASMIQSVDDATETLRTNLESLDGSIDSLLAGREPVELSAIETAMKQVKPTRSVAAGDKKAVGGEQSLKFSELVNQVIKEEGIQFSRGDTREERLQKSDALTIALATALKENKASFSQEFFNETKTSVNDLIDDTINFIAPLINNAPLLNAMLDKETGAEFWSIGSDDIQLVDMTNEELINLIPEGNKKELGKSVAAKLSPYLKSHDPNTVSMLQVEIQKMLPEEKAVALLKAREAADVKEIRAKTKKSSLGEFLSSINITQILTTAALGLLGGGLVGMPGLGVLALSLFSILGLSENKLAAPAINTNPSRELTSDATLPA
jgi:hypothetical protein